MSFHEVPFRLSRQWRLKVGLGMAFWDVMVVLTSLNLDLSLTSLEQPNADLRNGMDQVIHKQSLLKALTERNTVFSSGIVKKWVLIALGRFLTLMVTLGIWTIVQTRVTNPWRIWVKKFHWIPEPSVDTFNVPDWSLWNVKELVLANKWKIRQSLFTMKNSLQFDEHFLCFPPRLNLNNANFPIFPFFGFHS